MTAKLLFVADLGRLRTFRLEDSRNFSHARLTLLDDSQTNVSEHLSEELTDQAGRFRKGPLNGQGPSALSDDERHNLDLERRRRAVKFLAQRIDQWLGREPVDSCYLAADSRINEPILDEMEPHNRAKIQKNLAVNLSKLDPEEIIKHFCE